MAGGGDGEKVILVSLKIKKVGNSQVVCQNNVFLSYKTWKRKYAGLTRS